MGVVKPAFSVLCIYLEAVDNDISGQMVGVGDLSLKSLDLLS